MADARVLRLVAPLADGHACQAGQKILAVHVTLLWSPGERFIYFVQGAVPDRMDIWRIRPAGGRPEQMARHGAHVD